MDTLKPNQSMRTSIGRIFSQSLCNALSTMAGFTLEEMEISEAFINHSIAGAMMLVGEKSMFLVISANSVAARILISYMTGIEPSDLTQCDLQDGITEFANMVAGSAKKILANTEYEYNLTVPFTIVGDNIKFLTKNKIEKHRQLFQSNDVQILLQVFAFKA